MGGVIVAGLVSLYCIHVWQPGSMQCNIQKPVSHRYTKCIYKTWTRMSVLTSFATITSQSTMGGVIVAGLLSLEFLWQPNYN